MIVKAVLISFVILFIPMEIGVFYWLTQELYSNDLIKNVDWKFIYFTDDAPELFDTSLELFSDYRSFRSAFVNATLPESVALWVDRGFAYHRQAGSWPTLEYRDPPVVSVTHHDSREFRRILFYCALTRFSVDGFFDVLFRALGVFPEIARIITCALFDLWMSIMSVLARILQSTICLAEYLVSNFLLALWQCIAFIFIGPEAFEIKPPSSWRSSLSNLDLQDL